MAKNRRRFAVEVPEFDPEVDAMYITVGDVEYALIIDLDVLYEMEKRGYIQADGNSEFGLDTALEVIALSAKRKHPEVTVEDVKDWFGSPKAISKIIPTFMEYLEEVTQGMQGDGSGEAVATRG